MNLNNIQFKDFMCGCLLGDGFLRKQYQNATYGECHSKKQKDYLLWKKNTIEHNLDTEFKYNEYPHNIYNSVTCRIDSKTHKYFTKLYNLFYPNKKKILPMDYLDKYLDIIGLAIWFMDDGCTSWRKQYGTIKMLEIATQSFTKEEVEYLQSLLVRKFNIYTTISEHRGYRIRIYGENARNFINIIKPIVYNIPCMKYKVDFNAYMNIG